MHRKYYTILLISILVIAGYYFFNRSEKIPLPNAGTTPENAGTTLSEATVQNVVASARPRLKKRNRLPEGSNAVTALSPSTLSVCLEHAAMSAQSIQSLDPTKKLKAGGNVIQLLDIASGEVTGFWVLLIDESTGMIGGLSTSILDEGEIVPYSATPFETPVEQYPPISAESLVQTLTEKGVPLQPGSTARLVFVDGRYISIPIYEVSMLSGKTALYSGIDGSEFTMSDGK